MKKFITVVLTVLLCCAPLCACSTDFSAQIDEAMDGLYETLYNALELFFKQTGAPDDDSESDSGIVDGEESSTPEAGDENGGESEGNNTEENGGASEDTTKGEGNGAVGNLPSTEGEEIKNEK